MESERISKAQDRLTRLHARVYHGPIESVSSFTGEEGDKVYWFSGESPAFGQATLVGTIILNESRIQELSETAANLVYQHEKGHLVRRPEFRGLFIGMLVICAYASYHLFKSLLYLPQVLNGAPITPFVTLAGVSASLIGLFMIAFWLEELTADLHAIKELGESEFVEAYEVISEKSDNSVTTKLIVEVLYPSVPTVVKAHRMKQRITG